MQPNPDQPDFGGTLAPPVGCVVTETRGKDFAMGKGLLLWLIGIPIPIILLLYLFVFR
ncbi:MAG: hypothetical protein V4459_03155 [Pseudomonadota bacterium]